MNIFSEWAAKEIVTLTGEICGLDCDSSLTSSSEEYFGGKIFDKTALWKSHSCLPSSVHRVNSQAFVQTVQGLTYFLASCLSHCEAEVILVSMISPRFTSSFVGLRLINSHLETPKMLLLLNTWLITSLGSTKCHVFASGWEYWKRRKSK